MRTRHIEPTHLTLNNEVFDWCVRSGKKALAAGNPEKAAEWCLLAGHTAEIFGHNQLASPQLEALLLSISSLITNHPLPAKAHTNNRKRWLHVFSQTYAVGGHTALATRWIELDPNKDEHSLILTFQEIQQVSFNLSNAVKASGGTITALEKTDLLLDRAAQLRSIAYNSADYVVLHTHPWDILPCIAFGINAGPPVLLVNHADHVFWIGVSVADTVLNLRPSGEMFSKKYRGVRQSFTLPIPLPSPPPIVVNNKIETESIRQELSIPPDAVILLTIGTKQKYRTSPELNFLETARQIIERFPMAYLIAIGPEMKDPDWQTLHRSTGGHVIPIGLQKDLVPYHRIADIYLEGFPFGSLTALLEAGAASLPCVRAPEPCPLPFKSDGTALEGLLTPVDVEAYVEMVVDLARNKDLRTLLGKKLSEEIRKIHCGLDWTSHLQNLRHELPQQHTAKSISEVPNLPKPIEHYWSNFILHEVMDNAVSHCFRSAYRRQMKPRLDLKLWRVMRETKLNGGCRMGNPTVILLASYLLSLLPPKYAVFFYNKT